MPLESRASRARAERVAAGGPTEVKVEPRAGKEPSAPQPEPEGTDAPPAAQEQAAPSPPAQDLAPPAPMPPPVKAKRGPKPKAERPVTPLSELREKMRSIENEIKEKEKEYLAQRSSLIAHYRELAAQLPDAMFSG